MEKFFIITEESPLHKDYFDWVDTLQQTHVLVKPFLEANSVEATLYGFYGDDLCIVPTENDLNKFKNILSKEIRDGLRSFKGNSKIQKAWTNLLKEKNIERKSKPYAPMYFSHCCGKMNSRLFDIDNVVYCSFKQVDNFDTPEGMIEIKASKFWEIIENEEERKAM
jgi:hypothetical protein